MSLNREVLGLAWPVMIAMALSTILSLVDAFWLGRLGTDALAAVAPAQFASWLLWTLGSIIETGLPALVAQAVGASDWIRARRGAATSVQAAVVLGVLLGAVADPFARLFFSFVDLAPPLGEAGIGYLRLIFIGSGFYFVFLALEGSFRATGDTKTPMRFSILLVSLNIVLDPILIFGWLGFPRLEVAGAAWATVAAEVITVIAFLFYQARRPFVLVTRGALRRIDLTSVATLLRVGVPGGVTSGAFTAVYLVLSVVVAKMGAVPLAVLGVGNRLESINYLIASGFTVAASTLVGQNAGRGDVEGASRAARRSIAFGGLFTGSVGALFFFFAPTLFGWFSSDPAVIAEGTRFLRTIAVCQVWTGIESAVYGVFAGAGRTTPAMTITLGASALRVGLAVVAVMSQRGPLTIWWILASTAILRGALMLVWFHRGSWREAVLRAGRVSS